MQSETITHEQILILIYFFIIVYIIIKTYHIPNIYIYIFKKSGIILFIVTIIIYKLHK